MPTDDREDLPADNDDDDEVTKCMCTICGGAITPLEALECEECGCFFCSSSCAQKFADCAGTIHH